MTADDRARFLVDVSRSLSGAQHPDRAVALVLDLLVGPVVAWAQLALREGLGFSMHWRGAAGGAESQRVPRSDLDRAFSLSRVLRTAARDYIALDGTQSTDDAVLSSVAPGAAARRQLASAGRVDLLTVALAARGTTYGTLTLVLPEGSARDAATVAVVEDVAHHVAVHLDATRTLAESRRVAAVLSRDLEPPSLPILCGVRTATYYRVAFEHEAVGGDFYDVHGSSREWTAVMGDVCGKGVEAAVLTGKVRQSVRTAALVDRDPGSVLLLINRVLIEDAADTFVTAVCVRGRRDGDDLILDVASAGHPPALVVRQDATVEAVTASGPALGLMEAARYAHVRVRLRPGETCLLYTDGVTEAPGRRSRFGDQRLLEQLQVTGNCAATAQVESLAVALSEHLQDRPHDDIAILALQCEPARASSGTGSRTNSWERVP